MTSLTLYKWLMNVSRFYTLKCVRAILALLSSTKTIEWQFLGELIAILKRPGLGKSSITIENGVNV